MFKHKHIHMRMCTERSIGAPKTMLSNGGATMNECLNADTASEIALR